MNKTYYLALLAYIAIGVLSLMSRPIAPPAVTVSRRNFLKALSVGTPKIVVQGQKTIKEAVKAPLVASIESFGAGQVRNEVLKTGVESALQKPLTRRAFLNRSKVLGAKVALANLDDSANLFQKVMNTPQWIMNNLNWQNLAIQQTLKTEGLPKNKILSTVMTLLMKSPIN